MTLKKANKHKKIIYSGVFNDKSRLKLFHEYVKKYVEELDFSDSDYPAVSFPEMVGVLKKLKIGSSPGEDGIHRGLPNSLKTAIITMIPKKESSSPLPSDYRPISLKSCIGKFIDRIVRNRPYRFLAEKNIIIKEQSGFRNKRRTADNLVFII